MKNKIIELLREKNIYFETVLNLKFDDIKLNSQVGVGIIKEIVEKLNVEDLKRDKKLYCICQTPIPYTHTPSKCCSCHGKIIVK